MWKICHLLPSRFVLYWDLSTFFKLASTMTTESYTKKENGTYNLIHIYDGVKKK